MSDQRVVAVAATERVVADATAERIVPRVAVEHVSELIAEQRVVAGTAVERHWSIEIASHRDRVRGGTARQLRLLEGVNPLGLGSDNRRVADGKDCGVAGLDHTIDSVASEERVRSRTARDSIVAVAAINPISRNSADQCVVAVESVERHDFAEPTRVDQIRTRSTGQHRRIES